MLFIINLLRNAYLESKETQVINNPKFAYLDKQEIHPALIWDQNFISVNKACSLRKTSKKN
jgi:hypothetical protein